MTPAERSPLVVHAVGDVGFGGALRDLTAPDGSEDPFAGLSGILGGSDILFGNLETPLVPEGMPPALRTASPRFAGDPRSCRWLAKAGFSIISLANNHVMDHGAEGLRATMAALDQAGIVHVGAGKSIEQARRPRILETRGWRVGFLAYAAPGAHSAGPSTAGAAPLSKPLMLEDLAALRSIVDLIVVSAHFGLIYSDYPRMEDQKTARLLCEAGASLVAGHHPHVLQGIEPYRDAVIAYSLGELLFDPASGHVTNRTAEEVRRESIVLRVTFEADRSPAIEVRPASRPPASLLPVAAEGAVARRIAERVGAISLPLRRGELTPEHSARSAAERTIGHQWNVFLHHLRRGHLLLLAGWLARVRPKHLRLALAALRARWSAGGRAAGTRSEGASRGGPADS